MVADEDEERHVRCFGQPKPRMSPRMQMQAALMNAPPAALT